MCADLDCFRVDVLNVFVVLQQGFPEEHHADLKKHDVAAEGHQGGRSGAVQMVRLAVVHTRFQPIAQPYVPTHTHTQ